MGLVQSTNNRDSRKYFLTTAFASWCLLCLISLLMAKQLTHSHLKILSAQRLNDRAQYYQILTHKTFCRYCSRWINLYKVLPWVLFLVKYSGVAKGRLNLRMCSNIDEAFSLLLHIAAPGKLLSCLATGILIHSGLGLIWREVTFQILILIRYELLSNCQSRIPRL